MHVLKITISNTNIAQPVITKAIVPAASATFSIFVMQDNGSNNMWIGDSAVTTNNGIQLFPTGSFTATPALQYTGDLNEFYVYGTAGDVLNIMVFD